MRKVKLFLGAGLALGALLFNIAPASANTGDTVTAAVTGETNTGTTAPPIDFVNDPAPFTGAFTGVQIAGAFTANATSIYVGSVCAASIGFTTTQTLLAGEGVITGGSFNNCGTAVVPATVSGGVTGAFTRLGVVALAGININYLINGASGDVLAEAVVVAVPGTCLSGPGNPGCSSVVGPVVTV